MWWGRRGVVQRAEKMPKPQQTALITPSQKSAAKKTPLTPYICPDIHIFLLLFTLTFYRIVYVSWVVVQNKKKEKASSMCESISFSSSAKKEHKGISSHSKSCALLTSTKKKNCCKDEDFRTKILFDFSFFFFLRAGWGYSDGANRRFVLTADENLKLAFFPFPFHYKGFRVRRFRPHKVWFFSFETWHKKNPRHSNFWADIHKSVKKLT